MDTIPLMKKQDFYYWRLIATAISFTTFGLGGLALRLLFPILHLLPGDKHTKAKRARKIVHLSFRFFIAQMKFFGIYTYETHGLEKLQPGQLIIANHPTLIDVVFLISFIENANCIVKYSLFNNPFTRGPVNNAAYIPNIEGNQLVNDCVASLKSGDSLIIFPEGTRTPINQAPKLQRGAANIALAAGITPTMITIDCSSSFLSKGVKWYDIPLDRPHLIFALTELGDISDLSFDPKSARKLTDMFMNHFFGGSSKCH
jgi:1-acyl-sn-glycerol-3-phosphate acyltransferase